MRGKIWITLWKFDVTETHNTHPTGLFYLKKISPKKKTSWNRFPAHPCVPNFRTSGPASRHFRSQLRISSALALFNSKCFFAAAPGSWRSTQKPVCGLGDGFCWGGNPSKCVQHSDEKFESFSMCCFFPLEEDKGKVIINWGKKTHGCQNWS